MKMVIGFLLLICFPSIRGNTTSGEEPGIAGLLAQKKVISNGFAVWLQAVKNRIAPDDYFN